MFRSNANRWVMGFVVLGLLAVSALTAQAAVVAWTGGDGSNWDDTANWSTGAMPQSGDVAAFNSLSTNNLSTITLNGADRSVLGLQEATPGGDVMIGGSNTLNIGTSGIDMSSSTNNLTLNCNVAIGSPQSWTVNAGTTLTVGGAISSTNGLTKLGGGTLSLGSATITGPTTIGAAPSTFGGMILLNNGAALQNSAVTIYNSGWDTWAQAINFGPGVTTATFASLSATGPCPMPLDNTGGSLNAVTLTVGGNNASTTYGGAFYGTGTLVKVGTGTLSFTNGNWIDFQTGQGWAGNFVLQGGELSLNSARQIPQADAGGPGASMIFQGGMLQWATTDTNAWDLAHLGTIDVQGTGFNGGFDIMYANVVLPVNANLTGTGSFTKAGAGTVLLGGNNSYTGGTTVTGGSLQMGNWSSLGGAGGSSGPLTVTAGTLDLNGNSPTVGALSGAAGTITNSSTTASALSTLTVSQSGTTTFSGTLADGATNKLALSLGGAGTLVLNGANSYSGATTVNAAMLQMKSAGALPAASSIAANGGTLDLGGNTFTQTGASVAFNGGVVQNGSLVYGGTYTATGGTVSANLGGTAGLTKLGTGLLVLSGTNTFSGPTTIGSSSAVAGVGYPIGNSPAPSGGIILDNGAALQNSAVYIYGGGQDTWARALLFGPGVTSATFASLASSAQTPLSLMTIDAVPQPVTLTVGGNNASTTFNGAIWSYSPSGGISTVSQAGTLIKVGTGTLTLNEANRGAYSSYETNPALYQGVYTLKITAGEVMLANWIQNVPGLDNPASSPGTPGSIVVNGGMLGIDFADSNGWDQNGINNDIVGTNFNGGIDIAAPTMNLNLWQPQLTGTGSFTKAGPGTLLLGAYNSYTGGTTITGGSLQMGNWSALGGSGGSSGPLTVTAGTLDLNGFSPSVGPLSGLGTITNSSTNSNALSTLTVSQTGTTTFSGTLADGATNKVALSKSGIGTLVLNGINSYSGATTVSAGMLQISSAGALPAASSIAANGGTLDLEGNTFTQTGASVAFNGGLVQNGSLLYAGTYTATGGTVSANLGGTAGLTKTGNGLLVLSGNNTLSGNVTIGAVGNWAGVGFTGLVNTYGPNSAGGIIIANGAALQNAALYTYTGDPNNTGISFLFAPGVTSGTIGSLGSYGQGPLNLMTTDATPLPVNLTVGGNNASTTWAGAVWSYTITGATALSSAGTLTKVGSGTLTMSEQYGNDILAWSWQTGYSANVFENLYGLNLVGGEVVYNNVGFLPGFRNPISQGTYGAIKFSGGMLGINFADSDPWDNQAISNEVAGANFNGGIDTIQAAETLNLSTQLTGTGSFTKAGPGAVSLSGNNSGYSGSVNLTAGQLNINSASALGTGAFTISGGTIDNTSGGDITLTTNSQQNWNADFTYAGSAHNLNLGTGAVTLGGNRQVTVAANMLTVGGVGGGYSLTKLGAGTLTLAGNNTYTGTTAIVAGTLQIGNGGSGEALASPTISNSGALVFNNADAMNYSGSISGTGSLTKLGGGTLGLGSANSFSGATTIGAPSVNGGMILLNNGAALQDSAVYINGQGPNTAQQAINFAPGVTAATFASLAGQGQNPIPLYTTADTPLTPASGMTLTVGGNNASTTFGGTFWGTGTLVKVGSGILTLSDNNGNDWVDWDLPSGAQPVWAGHYVIAGGELSISSVRQVPQADAGGPGQSMVFQGGMLQYTGNSPYSSDLMNIGTWQVQGANFNGGFDVTQAGVILPVQGPLTGTGSFTKAGAGTVLLGVPWQNNTYSGGTNINGGILSLGGAAALGTSGNITFGGGTLQFTSANTNDYSARIKNSAAPVSIDTNGQTVTFAGPIDSSNTDGLLVTDSVGGGKLILSNADNTYLGGTEVDAGTLQVMASDAIPYGSGLTVGTNGTVDFGTPGAGTSLPQVATFAAPHGAAVAAVPEPGTLALLLAGLVVGFGLWRRRKVFGT